MREELLIKWRKGEIQREDYCIQMREILELTLPYQIFLQEGEKYLTKEEQTWQVGDVYNMNPSVHVVVYDEWHECKSCGRHSDSYTVAEPHDYEQDYTNRTSTCVVCGDTFSW